VSYTVELKSAPQRQLKKLEKPIRDRILKKLEALAIDPRPQGLRNYRGKSMLIAFELATIASSIKFSIAFCWSQ